VCYISDESENVEGGFLHRREARASLFSAQQGEKGVMNFSFAGQLSIHVPASSLICPISFMGIFPLLGYVRKIISIFVLVYVPQMFLWMVEFFHLILSIVALFLESLGVF